MTFPFLEFIWVFSLCYVSVMVIKFIAMTMKEVPQKMELNYLEKLFLYLNISYILTYIFYL
jgi:hypothetical protein